MASVSSPRSNMSKSLRSEGTRVYFSHEHYIWISGTIVSETGKNTYDVNIDDEDIPEDVIQKMTTYCGKLDDLPLQNESKKPEGVDDMVSLNYLHEASILDNLRRRFKYQCPYTYVGNIVIAVNPYQWIKGIYSNELKDEHLNHMRHDLKPHVYGTSATAFKGLRDYNKNQSILVSGESGAGKTETVKILMAHIAHISSVKSDSEEDSNEVIIERVLKSNPLLESFGNAKTGRNDNSSRFGKFTQLQFNDADRGSGLIGSKCITYLLEKSRVVTQNDSKERNYHVFHQLFAAPEAVKTRLFHDKNLTARDFQYTCKGDTKTTSIEGMKDGERFNLTMQALELLGVSGSDREHIQAIVAGILYLGEINFLGDTETSSIDPSQTGTLTHCCHLLGLDVTEFIKRTTSRAYVVHGESNLTAFLSRDSAIEGRHALAKDLYFRLFSWLVMVINRSTAVVDSSGLPQDRTISLLDIFGFEYFHVNRFEQLNINYANEKLQEKFTNDVFTAVQAEYKAEGLKWETITYKSNSDVLELLEGKQGVFASLNEECFIPKGSDMNYLSKLANRQAKHPCFSQSVHMGRESFCIAHYAAKVVYNVVGFVDRNKDTLSQDTKLLMLTSNNSLIHDLYSSDDPSAPCIGRVRSNSGDSAHDSVYSAHHRDSRIGFSPTSNVAAQKRNESFLRSDTVIDKFKAQLTSLMLSISATTVQYVRCIKPNSVKSSTLYDRKMVVEQLRCAGVIEAIRISRAAYPYRLTHLEFMDHFGILKPQSWFSKKSGIPQSTKCKMFLEETLSQGLLVKVDPTKGSQAPYEIGKSRIYFSSGVLETLERMRSEKYSKSAILLQKRCRGLAKRLLYKKQRKASILVQSIIRRFLHVRRYTKILKKTIRIQVHIRMLIAKTKVHHLRRHLRCIRIQKWVRMITMKYKYGVTLKSVIKLQTWMRMNLKKASYKILLQKAKQQADLLFQLEDMKQKLQDENKLREEMAIEMEKKLQEERELWKQQAREEMLSAMARETAVIQNQQLELKAIEEEKSKFDEEAFRNEIKREFEIELQNEKQRIENDLIIQFKQKEEVLRETFQLELSEKESKYQKDFEMSVQSMKETLASQYQQIEAKKIEEQPKKVMVDRDSQTDVEFGFSLSHRSNSISLQSPTPNDSVSATESSVSVPSSISPMTQKGLFPLYAERRGSTESIAGSIVSIAQHSTVSIAAPSLESGITSVASEVSVVDSAYQSLQTEVKKLNKKIDFLTKENLSLKSMVQMRTLNGSDENMSIREKASLEATIRSHKSDIEKLNTIISQMKEEKLPILQSLDQLSAELELSNAEKDDFARRLEYQREEHREQIKMMTIYLRSKRIDSNIIQELTAKFEESSLALSAGRRLDKPEKSVRKRKPRALEFEFDDNLSSVSTHREDISRHSFRGETGEDNHPMSHRNSSRNVQPKSSLSSRYHSNRYNQDLAVVDEDDDDDDEDDHSSHHSLSRKSSTRSSDHSTGKKEREKILPSKSTRHRSSIITTDEGELILLRNYANHASKSKKEVVVPPVVEETPTQAAPNVLNFFGLF